MTQKTKQKIFQEGLNLLGEEGFAGLTLGTLAARSDISKSGLFAHFKSKGELEDQLMQQVDQYFTKFIAAVLIQPKGLARLNAFFDAWIGWTAKAGLKGGCPIAAGLFEFDDMPLNNPTRMLLQAMTARSHSVLRDLCQDAISTGELKADLDIDQFLFEMQGIYLSHHVSLRFNRDPQADRLATSAFARLVRHNQHEGQSKK